MSLGLGVFLSTIIAIAAWQIDKRNAWRTTGKISLGLFGAVLVVGAAAYGYFGWWADLKSKRAHDAEIAQIHNPTDLKYWGIQLGMSQAEVRYLKGEPTEIEPAEKEKRTPEKWLYKLGEKPFQHYYFVHWDEANTRVIEMSCQGRDTTKCERIMGIGPESSEAAVRTALGKPDQDGPPNENGEKSFVYGTGKDKLRVLLSHGQVELIVLSRAG